MGILIGLAPFIAFFVLDRAAGTTAGLWIAAAVAAALILRNRQAGVKLLEAGALVLFLALAVAASFLHPAWSVFEVRFLVDLGLVAIAAGSVLVGRPFTLQYAREHVPPERWNHPLFLSVNRTISLVWVLAFVLEAASSAALAWVPSVPQPLAVLLNIAALAGAIWFTAAYPKHVRARFAAASRG